MSDLFLLKNSQIIDLCEIKLNDFDGYLFFHGSKNLNRDIVFQGKTYLYIPSELSNLEYNSEGKQSRPTLIISNVNNFITNLIKDRGDLIGKRFYRKKILAKDLDAENFGGVNKNTLGNTSFTSFISTETFILNKKNIENKEKVEFTLSNILDIDGLTVPTRKVFSDSCQWQYRGCGCNYGKLQNYSGPTVQANSSKYPSLDDVCTDFSLQSNLSLWLNEDGKTDGLKVKLYKKSTEDSSKTRFDYQAISAWADQSTTISGGSAKTVTISGYPKRYPNSGRLNNKEGVRFTYSSGNANDPTGFTSQWDQLTISQDYTSNNLTIFYVVEPVNIYFDIAGVGAPNGGYVNRGLANSDGKFLLGYYGGYKDQLFSHNAVPTNDSLGWVTYRLSNYAYDSLNIVDIYAACCPNTATGGATKFYKNGNFAASKNSLLTAINNLSINTVANEESELVIYEIIIFDKILNETEIAAVNSYLSSKYNLPISSTLLKFNSKNSSDFFAGFEDGNLGVPIGDENDKLFLSNQLLPYTNDQSYGLLDMTYKGDYDENTNYAKGDFVKIDIIIDYDFNESVIQKNFEIPSKFFVCVAENGVKGKNPLLYTNVWKEDKCSKTLNGCSLRFRGDKPLPFGGFPGTVTYEYKLPS